MTWYGMVWYGILRYGMVRYRVVWYGMVLYCMLWYDMVCRAMLCMLCYALLCSMLCYATGYQGYTLLCFLIFNITLLSRSARRSFYPQRPPGLAAATGAFLLSPGTCLHLQSRIGFIIPTFQPHILVDFHRILLTDALALPAHHFLRKKEVPTSTSMHSVTLKLNPRL